MVVIDADAHIVETDRTWQFVDEEDRKHAPVLVEQGRDAKAKRYWLIDGKVRARDSNVSDLFPKESRELIDVGARLRHLDVMGIDVQVLYPSILQAYTDRPEVELAFCRSYNRWLADACNQSNGRLRWAAILPLMSMDKALPELRFARDHGACAVFIRAIEAGNRQLYDPHFFPAYEEAQHLDVPVCVHASFGSTTFGSLYETGKNAGAFPKFQLAVVAAFHEMVFNDVPKQFPRLRFGFVETGAQWVPYVMKHLLRRPGFTGRTGPELMEENRLYVACELQEDLPYILEYSGDDHLVIGSDYSHADPHMEINAVRGLRARTDVPTQVVAKILDDNPRALYGL
jgi:predicted TIM-barrel fold metal-dependent hydrolase